MADQQRGPGEWDITVPDNNNSARDRATVALVDAKVDGLKDLMRAEFGYIKERMAPLASVVADVAGLRKDVDDHERRIDDMEAKEKGDRDYRRIHLPSIVISGTVAIGSIIALLTQLH